jgi:NADP-reducing hydrogenase subunit HndD
VISGSSAPGDPGSARVAIRKAGDHAVLILREVQHPDGSSPLVDPLLRGIMIRQIGIDFNSLADTDFDDPLGMSTGAGLIFGTTGGVMEAALRTVNDLLTGGSSDALDYNEVRGIDTGIKEAEVKIADLTLKVAVAHGLGNARQLMNRMKAGEHFDFIEVMACPGGCINGGGQPLQVSDVRNWIDFKEKRARALYEGDQKMFMRKSHNNPAIRRLYKEYLGFAGGMKAHKLLHTHYVDRSK